MEGHNVIGIDDLSSGDLHNLPRGFDMHKMDIRDPQVRHVVAEINPDLIFHLAAQSIVSTSFTNPLETFGTNIIGSANILESFI